MGYQFLPVLIIIIKTQWSRIKTLWNKCLGKHVESMELIDENIAQTPLPMIENEEEFEKAVSQNPLVIVFVQGTFCKPCHRIEPDIERLNTMSKDITFYKIDVQQLNAVCKKHNVIAVPTFLSFKDDSLCPDLTVTGTDMSAICNIPKALRVYSKSRPQSKQTEAQKKKSMI